MVPGQRYVALRKESVDRNRIDRSQLWVDWRSLSARRAWIEIMGEGAGVSPGMVALRKESVDRNPNAVVHVGMIAVALRKESVDRNNKIRSPV